MFESVLGTKLWVFDPALVTIMYCVFSINTLLICARPPKCSFLLDTHSKGVYIIGRVFLVFFVDLSVADNSQDCIRQLRCFFFPRCLDCQYQGGEVFAEVSKKVPLESHLNNLL